MNYSFNNLYFGIVEYYYKKDFKFDVHALYNDNNTEELFDLDLQSPILNYGEDQIYYKRSLISFKEVMHRTRISWGCISYKDALKIKENYIKYYFKLLRDKNINDINDLKEVGNIIKHKSKKQRR